ncbi:MAG: hypothetical protein WAO61_06290 [Solirubrobacterales bacterium]
MNDDDPNFPPTEAPSDVVATGALGELERMLGELREKVTALREGELDAETLELRLREVNELAVRAASTLDRAAG